ncbi:MAG: glycosyltransferase involved in cell wall biosynthesis [Alphaproteobacteria bacterium]|jgi:glycosyltransferase involved in cell wall biosynthesis
MQTMAGAEVGGAEAFFVRLVIALQSFDISQEVVIRRDPSRARALREGGITPIELPFGGRMDFRTRPALQREIARFRPDVILSWMSRAAWATPAAPGSYAHIGRLGGYYDLKYYSHCDYLVGNTADIVDYVISEGFDRDRVVRLPNFVHAPTNPPLSRVGLDTPLEAPLLLAMGRLHENKAFDTLLRALPEVPDAWLWIAGDGPEAAALKGLARDLGVADRTRFLGWRDDSDALMNAADIFICPSRHEPLGNVVLEAWAAEKPVIAAAAVGPLELLGRNERGLLVPVDQPSELASAINDLLANPEKASRLAAAGRAAYEREFTMDAVTAQYLAFFEKARRECAA